MDDTELAGVFAGRYIDGLWSYTQALYEAKKRGISKEDFDAAVFEVKRTSVDRENGWEKPK